MSTGSMWDLEYIKRTAAVWQPSPWVLPGVTDTQRWYNELYHKLGERLARMDNDYRVLSAQRHLQTYKALTELDGRLQCFLLDMASGHLRQ